MKRYMLPISFLVIFVLPNLLFSLVRQDDKQDKTQQSEITEQRNYTQMILIQDDHGVREMELEDYIVCVLLGEVPAEFEPEALRAQAIATRTYTLRMYIDRNKHENAHVCAKASCCQAYVPEELYLSSGHTNSQLKKIKDAVKKTSGQVLTYNGELIESTYFSCAGDRTEAAEDVWGREVPYLVSVESPGEEIANNYQKKTYLSVDSFIEKLYMLELKEIQESDIEISYTKGGGVAEAKILNHTFSGQELRMLLDLPSTVIHFEIDDEIVIISTKGSGHRVGMSQYGAQAMALRGKTAEEILLHYYTGVNLATLCETQLTAAFDKAENL